jgi:ComF family protein
MSRDCRDQAPTRHAGGAIVVSMLVPPLCWGCGGVARRREPLCAACRRLLRRLGQDPVLLCGVPVWAPVAYSGPARDLVRALKFRGATAVADAMAAQMAANAPARLLGERGEVGAARAAPAPVLVPVPLHRRRLRRRGYNQAARIAAALARRAGLEVADCLARTGSPATQVGRDRSERRVGPAGSVELTAPLPDRVVLVDDVATTGATLAACAAVARAAGAREITALVFARTMGR